MALDFLEPKSNYICSANLSGRDMETKAMALVDVFPRCTTRSEHGLFRSMHCPLNNQAMNSSELRSDSIVTESS